ncbi:MAG TPA: acetoacetate--CoA ligase [Steroidobacteraceae bacterium]|nr:acetoacetate--CoA ligase [Steroidobacteraceae bacterium]
MALTALCTTGSAQAADRDPFPTPTPLYVPSPEALEATQLTAFMRHCEAVHGGRFPDYGQFEQWSITQAPAFWTSLLQWSGLRCEGALSPAITDERCEHARFFPDLRLNYVENLLAAAQAGGNRAALTAVHWDGSVQRWQLCEVCEQVGALSAAFQELGLQPGERVALLAHNGAPAVIATLAAAALGGTVATVAPDLGTEALLTRLGQIAPVLLLTDLGGYAAGVMEQRRERLIELARSLGSLRAVVLLDEDAGSLPGLGRPLLSSQELIARHAQRPLRSWPRLPFNHPLFILFTSGTTGMPKCLVHGAGGTLLEHLKEHRLHCDISSRDRLFFHTSTGWMMWHWQLSALASGAELVLYDGPISSAASLWRIVAEQQVTLFGTSAAYLQLCEHTDARAIEGLDFAALRAVLSTGSILNPAEQDWVSAHVKALPVQSISGGTDIVGCFVLGNPNLPAYSAECQCRSLGMDVRAWPTPSLPTPSSIGVRDTPSAGPGVGELVCMNPFPSRPLGILNDPLGEQFHASYFARHPGCWTHGDLIEFTARGTAVIHGRTDSVLNVRGVRIGPAEIYRILSHVGEICDCMAVEQQAPEEVGGSRLVLLVVLREGGELTDELTRRIRQELQAHGSAAHVPSVILPVSELPTTYSGKRSEHSARDALNGIDAANAQALRNPQSLEPLRRFGRQSRASPGLAPASLSRGRLDEAEMIRIWQEVLGVKGLTGEDNFFDLGGTSLAALRLLASLQRYCQSELTLSLLYEAPTVGGLLAAVNRELTARPSDSLRLLSGPAAGTALFLVHGFGGSAMELRPLARSLRLGAPVYGIEARGFRSDETPQDRVEDMARTYVADVRVRQPHGPYRMIGYSFGGLVAYEMARVLEQAGESVALVGLMDSTTHERFWPANARFEYLPRQAYRYLRRLQRSGTAGRVALARELRHGAQELLRRVRAGSMSRTTLHENPESLPANVLRVREAALVAYANYRPCPCGLPLTLVRSELKLSHQCDPRRIWRTLTPALTIVDVPGDHLTMIRPPHLSVLAERISRNLQA